MRNQKGITLIALVITIVVLLILAGVTISLTAGKNGALSQARKAVSANDIATAAEEINISASDAQMRFYDAWNTNQNAKSINYYGLSVDGNSYQANCSKAKAIGLCKEEDTAVGGGKVYVKYITNGDVAIYFEITVNSDDTYSISKGYSAKDTTLTDADKTLLTDTLAKKTYTLAKGTSLEEEDAVDPGAATNTTEG